MRTGKLFLILIICSELVLIGSVIKAMLLIWRYNALITVLTTLNIIVIFAMAFTTYLESKPIPVKKIKREISVKKLEEKLPLECPSCGSELAVAQLLCTRCGARTYGRASQRNIVVIAATLLVVGIILFRFASIYAETEISKISELGEDDNFRHVRVIGRVTEIPKFYTDKYGGGTIKFYLNDTTGELPVKCSSEVLDKLISERKIPAFGDIVDLEGTLYAGEEYRVIKIFSSASLRIKPRIYEELTIDSIASKNSEADFAAGKLVKISGIINSVYRLSFAYNIYVGDELGNEIPVFITSDFAELTGWDEVKNLSEGNDITVKGALKWYSKYSQWEVIPTSSREIVATGISEIVSKQTYFPTTVEELLGNTFGFNNTLVVLENSFVADEGSYSENYSSELRSEVVFRVATTLEGASLRVYVESFATRPLNLTYGSNIMVKGLFIAQEENEWCIRVRVGTDDSVEIIGGL